MINRASRCTTLVAAWEMVNSALPDSCVHRSQYDTSFHANESLEIRKGCNDGSLDHGHNVGDLNDCAVGGNKVSCQSTESGVQWIIV